MADYFYDKYVLIIDYEEVPETIEVPEESYLVYTDNVIREQASGSQIKRRVVIYRPEWDTLYSDYSVQVDKVYTDTIKSYRFVLSGEPTFTGSLHGKSVYRSLSQTEIEELEVRSILATGGRLCVILLKKATLKLEVTKIVKKYSRGALLETNVVKDSSYPKNGQRAGFWWVRKGPYTIPPPELISPKNAFMLNRKTGEEMPSFEFLLVPREIDDQNLYHARIRIGTHSDFSDYDVYLESKEDTTGWECFLDGKWVPFPVEGVPAGTRVRVRSEIENVKFGFLYWDAAAYNSKWAYGMNSEHRLIIVIDEMDRSFILSINGISYNPLELGVSESSNGELGSIEIVLSNHNI